MDCSVNYRVAGAFLLWLALFFFCSTTYAQSPGGVGGANLKIWVKGDVGVTGTTNVSAWADQSGSSNNFTQATAANQPALITNDINGHATINFANSTSIMSPASAPANLNTTIFTVAAPGTNANWRTMFRGTANDHPLLIQDGTYILGYYDNDNSTNLQQSGFTWQPNEIALASLEMRTGDVNFRKNGTQGTSLTTINLSGLNLNYFGNYQSNNQQFGRIGETIIYNSASALTTTEKQRIESYLAIKYGLTITHNYLAADGSTVWNTTTNVGYNNNITGIGRDDASALDQRTSTSVLAGASVTMNKGGAFGVNNSFILWGDNAATGTNKNVPVTYLARTGRIWKAGVKGTPGTVSFSVNLVTIGMPNTGSASDYALLIDSDTDFSSGSTTHTTGVSLVGNVLSFTGVSLADGQFFTIAGNVSLPGGITGNLAVWLKANNGLQKAGAVAAGNGESVVTWADQSGSARNYVAVAGPTLQSSTLNFNPSAEILSGGFDAPAGAELTDDYTMFFVSRKLASDNDGRLFETNTGNSLYGYWTTYVNSIYLNGVPANHNTGIATTTNNLDLYLHSYKRESSGNTLEARTNGSSLATFPSSNSVNGLRIDINAGPSVGSESSNSRVGEVIMYNSVLASADVDKIESYLGIKYGLTLSHNYTTANGTVIWNTGTNAGYNNNITGIGRDDESGLAQPKSISSNTSGSVTLDKGGAFAANRTFLMWGDNALSGTSSNVAVTYTARSNRIWKTILTGTPGTVTFSVNLSTIGFPVSAVASNYVLLKDTDTDFSSGSTVHSTGASIVGNVLTFTNVSFTSGEYFTIAGSNLLLPAGVAGSVFWVKAEAGVTGTTDVSNWADQSGNSNDATQSTFANQPSLVTNAINFRSAIDFSGSTDVMSIKNAPTNLNSTIFTVAIPTVNTNWRTMFRGATSDHQIIIQSGGTTLGYFDNDNGGMQLSGFTWLQDEPALVSLEMQASDVNFRKNGVQGTSINTINQTGLNLNYFGNYQGGSQQFGKIAETIIFNTPSPLTTTEKEKVESYLAVKYGVTLAHNYTTANGTVTWNTATMTGYNNNIIGVGRDDASGLDQRKSRSVNTNTAVTIEKTGAFTSTLDFWMTGDDGGTLAASNSFVHPSYPMRVTRVWKTQFTGAPGLMNVSFDLGTGIFNSGVAGNYAILIKAGDTNFSSGATAYTGGASIVSNVITFTNVPLSSGDFFTLALPRVPSPGGVINGLNVWLKANAGVYSDAGTTAATNGGSVQRWADQTTLSNHGVNTGTPIWNSTGNLINFNPTVYYDGSSGHNLNYSVSNQYSLITIGQMEGTLNRRMFASRVGNTLSGTWNGREDVLYLDGSPSILGGQTATTLPRLYSLTRVTSGSYQFLKNGLLLSGGSASNNSTWQLGIGNGGATNESSKAYVSEVLEYNRSLNATELNKVHSYLGIKYGITQDQSTPTNYVASDGTIIWDATINGSYNINIAGIGRDDASALSQPKSRSVNSNSIVIIDKGTTFSANLDFIVWGSDNTYTTPTNVNAHPSYPYRIGKTWRVDLTGTPGVVSVSFDLSAGIYNTGVAANYALLIKNANSNFSSGATAHTTGASFAGSILTFTNVTLGDGDYFTLAMPLVPAPGGVVNDMTLWYKANQGVTGGASASAWADQSGNGFNVTQATAAAQPVVQTNRINFNPTLQFDGSDDNMSRLGGFLGNRTLNEAYAFVVSRTNVISNSSIFYELTASSQFNLHAPWSDGGIYWDAGDASTNRLAINWSGSVATPYLWGLQASTTSTPSGAKQDVYRNGFRIANDATMDPYTGNNNLFTIASAGNNYFYNGDIGEIVIYTGALTAVKTQQVQSYLALKYGITLSGMDYLSASAASIFSATSTQSGYVRDIAGIGRDDNSALDQRKSKSINTPSDILAGANTNFTTPAAFATNNQFLVWGHNGLVYQADAATPSYTHNGAAIVRQIARVWSTAKTGAPTGNVIIEMDMNLINGPSGLGTNSTADIRLLVDNDVTFGNASAGERAYTTSSVTAGKAYFTVPYSQINSGVGYMTLGSVNATTAPLTVPSPGGVAVDLRLWLKANVGVAGGANVSSWTDQSSYGFVASQATGANQPTVLSNQLNSNPSILFDGVNDDLTIPNGILKTNTYSDLYVYTVNRLLQVKQAKYFVEINSINQPMGAYIPWNDNNLYWDAGDWGTNNRLVVNWGGNLSTPYLWSLGGSTNTTPSGAKQDIFRNALRISNDNTMSTFTGANKLFTFGSEAGNNFYSGEISEMIMVTSAVTASQHQRIQSYLAIKYGITLDQTTAQNYVASDNSVIYDATGVNSGYKADIAGIGRDDNSALDQRKSQSVNPRSFVQLDKGAAFGADKTFLMWGSDNGFLGLTSTAAHPSLPYRITRVWRTDIAGTPGNVTVNFDLSVGVYNTGAASDYRLLIKNANANFSTGATALTGSLAGNTLTFTGVTFADGDYFSLGVANMPAPGGVVPNMHYWIKADLGVTGTSVSAWADQSGNGFNVAQSTSSSQPSLVSARTNFNPAVQFDGADDQLILLNGIMGTSTYTDLNVLMVTRANAVTASALFAETQASGGRIDAHVPWSDNNVYWDAGATSGSQRIFTPWGGTANTNYLWSLLASTTATASGSQQDIYRNGLRIANDNTMGSFVGNNSNFYLGSLLGGNFYNGDLDEMVFYHGALSLSQFQRIQSYLSVKYGVTLDQTSPQSYYASDWNGTTGTLIWDAATAGTYKSDIAAIGRDDNSALSQKQSASINTGNILAIGNNAIATDNIGNSNTFTANNSFFSWAHNNLALSTGVTYDFGTTTNSEVIRGRFARVWKAKETGTVGSLKLRFNLSAVLGVGGVAGENELADVRLLVDADGVFATGARSIAPTTYNNTTDIVNFDIDFTGATGYYFTLGTVNYTTAPLPVELVSLIATPTSKGTEVKWITETELNNDYFIVQVSKREGEWVDIAKVKGQGTTKTKTSYEFLHETPYIGKSYYRLKQVDFDGKTVYSLVVSVEYINDEVNIYPNPTTGNFKLRLADESGEIRHVRINNLQGVEVARFGFDSSNVNYLDQTLDVSSLAAGEYIVVVHTSIAVYYKKLIVIK